MSHRHNLDQHTLALAVFWEDNVESISIVLIASDGKLFELRLHLRRDDLLIPMPLAVDAMTGNTLRSIILWNEKSMYELVIRPQNQHPQCLQVYHAARKPR